MGLDLVNRVSDTYREDLSALHTYRLCRKYVSRTTPWDQEAVER